MRSSSGATGRGRHQRDVLHGGVRDAGRMHAAVCIMLSEGRPDHRDPRVRRVGGDRGDDAAELSATACCRARHFEIRSRRDPSGKLRLVATRRLVRVVAQDHRPGQDPICQRSIALTTPASRTARARRTPSSRRSRRGALLTDDVFLFRVVGVVDTDAGEMVELEDCFGLDVVQVPMTVPAPRAARRAAGRRVIRRERIGTAVGRSRRAGPRSAVPRPLRPPPSA